MIITITLNMIFFTGNLYIYPLTVYYCYDKTIINNYIVLHSLQFDSVRAGCDGKFCVFGSATNGSHLPDLTHNSSICLDIKQPHRHVLISLLQLPGADGPGRVPHILPTRSGPQESQTGGISFSCKVCSWAMFHFKTYHLDFVFVFSIWRSTARCPPSPSLSSLSWVKWPWSCQCRSWAASTWLTAGASLPWEPSAPGATDRWAHGCQMLNAAKGESRIALMFLTSFKELATARQVHECLTLLRPFSSVLWCIFV